MANRIVVIVSLAWVALNTLAVIYPRTLWMDIAFAAWLFIMFAVAILGAQRGRSALFYRVVFFVTMICFISTDFEPYFWSPFTHLAQGLLSFTDLSNLGPGAERTYSVIANKFFFLACCNISFLLGGVMGWSGTILDRRHDASGVE